MSEKDWKALFRKVYANLPFAAREEIIAVVNDVPFTWNSAKIEIDNDTSKGNQIIEMMVKLTILKDHE
ncbi:hypothetical protein HY031_03110 [Candidatus Gottesmanbacteria bacterium]|nr:hypothetical protein [Candidatus Gottesmanbacteria bacterium]